MSQPRSDGSSVISSLQMDYADSDEDEGDSKNNSYNINDNKQESKDVRMETENTLPASTEADTTNTEIPHTSSLISEPMDTKPDLIKSDSGVSPVDNISDEEHDSQSEHSHHHHSHHHRHHHHHHHKDRLRDEKPDIVSEALNTDSPASQGSIKLGKKATSLVSYDRDDDVDSSDDDEDEESEDEAETSNEGSLDASEASLLSRQVQNLDKNEITIPPEPPGKCGYHLQKKIEDAYNRMEREGFDHNRSMQEKKNFRNPSIYEKLIEFCHIDENGTNFPPEIYNPRIWGKESFYDELDKAQRKDMERREKEKKERTKIEFLTGTKKPATQPEGSAQPEEKKRKSKWDAQPSTISAQVSKLPHVQQNPGVVNLTATATGTKGKVISAVGTLSKKPSFK